MVRRSVVTVTALSFLVCLPAFGQPARDQPRTRVTPQPALTTTGSVVIFEQKDFAGRSQTLASGNNRLSDWRPASIQVPAGFVAELFESADATGGYGLSVDLME